MIRIFRLKDIPENEVQRIKQRAQADINEVRQQVKNIINDVRTKGDSALIEFTCKWDDPDFSMERLQVTKEDIETAYRKTSEETIEYIRKQIRLSRKFHECQRKRIQDWEEETSPGIIVGEKWTPIDEVGLYIPGGKNPFPTVQQILAVAAKTAGCRRIVSCISPKGDNYEVLIAANECGIKEIYCIGGAQAIAALAYGTETIKPVRLIAGPGNPYVTAAKMLCQKVVSIDMPAGPSEAVILADGSVTNNIGLDKKAAFCAADILARAEHGPDSAGVLVTNSLSLAEKIKTEVEMQLKGISRKEYAMKALDSYSAVIVTDSMDEAIAFTNEYAPEHLEIITKNPGETLRKITNAGSVFLGYYNPVATGDYASGLNHILPTGMWAKSTSPVGAWTFMKRVQYSDVTKNGLKKLQPIVDRVADIEGLDAHRKSVDIRLEERRKDYE